MRLNLTVYKVWKLASFCIFPLVAMVSVFQIGSDYRLPGILILVSYLVYLYCLNQLKENSKLFIGIIISLFVMGGAYKLQQDFWTKKNQETCERLAQDPFCELTENGYSCKIDSSFGEFKTSKNMCANN